MKGSGEERGDKMEKNQWEREKQNGMERLLGKRQHHPKKENRRRRRGRRKGEGGKEGGKSERERWNNKGDFASQDKIKSCTDLL